MREETHGERVAPFIVHPLTVEEIERVAEGFKDDLTRECERLVRRKDNSGALAAIAGKEYIEQFVTVLRLRAGSQFGRARQRKKRIKPIYIPEIVKNSPLRFPLPPEEAARQKHIQEVVAASRVREVKRY